MQRMKLYRTFRMKNGFRCKMTGFISHEVNLKPAYIQSTETHGIKAFEHIPGPKPLPFLGNIWRYFPIVGEYNFEKLHRTYAFMHHQYGALVREQVYGDRILVHVFDPHDMRTVYKNEGRRPVRRSHRALERYRRERPHIYSGPGLFPSNGDEWYRFRHLFQKVLMAPATADDCSVILENVTDDLVSQIPFHLDEAKELDLQPHLFKWALECIGAITLERRLGCLSMEGNPEAIGLVKAANDTHRAIFVTENTPLFPQNSYKKLEEAQDHLSKVVGKYMDESILHLQRNKDSHSVLSKMLQVEGATRKDVFTMILDMFLAGIDTTAFGLVFCLYNLARNPNVQETLFKELMHHLPKKNSKFGENKLKIPYLQAVIKESLRINPVAIGTGRIIPQDIVLSGYQVPANTMVILQHQVASMQEKHFKDAHLFRPERWMKGVEVFSSPLASCPFGYGPRLCVGMRFAQKEMSFAISKIIRNYFISYHHEDVDSCNRLINVPDRPFKLRFHERSS